jgi:hypothetical protein
MPTYKDFMKTKEKFSKAFNQAIESVRVLRVLEKETLAKARSFVRVPSAKERRSMTNERILKQLQKVGVASQAELEVLRQQVHKLQMELAQLREMPKKAKAKTKSRPSAELS